MDVCVLPILCWVALAPHSQEPVANPLGEGNATGLASEAEENGPQAGPGPAVGSLGLSIGICWAPRRVRRPSGFRQTC